MRKGPEPSGPLRLTINPKNCASELRRGRLTSLLAKVSIALEEADEAVGWLEMSHREGILRGDVTIRVLDEGRQLTRILAKSRESAQDRENQPGSPRDQLH